MNQNLLSTLPELAIRRCAQPFLRRLFASSSGSYRAVSSCLAGQRCTFQSCQRDAGGPCRSSKMNSFALCREAEEEDSAETFWQLGKLSEEAGTARIGLMFAVRACS